MKRLLVAALIVATSLTPLRVQAHSTESSQTPSDAALASLEVWEYTDATQDYARFIRHRRASAERVAYMAGINPTELEIAWATAPLDHQKVVLSAVSQIGNHYRYATADPDRGFDCSGLTRWAWSEGSDVRIPTTSRNQLADLAGVGEADPLPGDIWGWPGHVMIWLGVDNVVVHAANSRTGVVVGRANLDRVSQVRPASHLEA